MVLQNQSQEKINIASDGNLGVLWVVGWMLLTTAAFPLAFILMPPTAVGWMWLSDLGTVAGVWPQVTYGTVVVSGLIVSLAITISFFQWLMLRNHLPQAWKWFVATFCGIVLGSIASRIFVQVFSIPIGYYVWILAISLLVVGLTLGLAHWLYLRRFQRDAVKIILIDVLAVGSLIFLGRSITSLTGLTLFFLPGAISGLGMWILFRKSYLHEQSPTGGSGVNKRRWIWIGLGLVALVPLFLGYLWVYAASQLALAKHNGIYPTAEQAVIANNSQGWGDAKVIDIRNVHAGPNRRDGTQPFVWFGGASVTYDRIPAGARDNFSVTGSYYMHVRDGWILVPEGAFPEFIGWIMEMYHMEGVDALQ